MKKEIIHFQHDTFSDYYEPECSDDLILSEEITTGIVEKVTCEKCKETQRYKERWNKVYKTSRFDLLDLEI
ncbi:hypothetical protein LCGC14_0920300 [marine sediment metagenome]|uniref:Uncharacterized protein n=1 Tax=marine sediment metagenome TaxID=412755 RepID=A0A0F9NR37_9ZZZZ